MCHQSIFSFIKCQHTAQALTICNEKNHTPPQPCLEVWEGDFFLFDTICKGCQAVLNTQGQKNGQRIPRCVDGIHQSMPFEYVVGGQLPWNQPWYDAHMPPRANMVVWSEYDGWKIWDEQLSLIFLSVRDATPVRSPPCPKMFTTLSLSTAEASAPGCPQKRSYCHGHSNKQRVCTPRQEVSQYEAMHKPSIKQTDAQQTCPADQTHFQSESKHRVRFLPAAEIQYFTEDTAVGVPGTERRGRRKPRYMMPTA